MSDDEILRLAARHGIDSLFGADDRVEVLAFARALLARAPVQAGPQPLVMADGTPLIDYLASTHPKGQALDEWTEGYEECKRRLYRILAPQIAAAPQAEPQPSPPAAPEEKP